MNDRDLKMEDFIYYHGRENPKEMYGSLTNYGYYFDDIYQELLDGASREELEQIAKKLGLNCNSNNGFQHFKKGINTKTDYDFVKIYANLRGENSKEFVEDFMNFVNEQNLDIYFKVATLLRSDNLTIRIINREDIERVTNFINNYKNQEIFGEINPFILRNKNVGYMKDSVLSANMAISSILSSNILSDEKEPLKELKEYIHNNPNLIKRIIHNTFRANLLDNPNAQRIVNDLYESISLGIDSQKTFNDFINMVHEQDTRETGNIFTEIVNENKGKDICYGWRNDEFGRYKKCKYNEDGYDENGYDQSGYDKELYNENGYDIEGYNKEGWNEKGINKVTGTEYDIDGYNKNGRDKEGYDREGFKRAGFRKYVHKITGTEFNPEGYNKLGRDKDGNLRETTVQEKKAEIENLKEKSQELDFKIKQAEELKVEYEKLSEEKIINKKLDV